MLGGDERLEPPLMYRIVFLEGPLNGRRLTVEQGQVRLGSAPECSVRLPGGGLLTQVRVEPRNGNRFFLEDRSVTPALRVGGKLVHEIEAAPGDFIRIGDHGFRLEALAAGTPQRLRLRRTSGVQRATVAAVVVILCIQAFLVLGFSMLQRTPLTDSTPSEPDAETATATPRVVPAIPDVVLPPPGAAVLSPSPRLAPAWVLSKWFPAPPPATALPGVPAPSGKQKTGSAEAYPVFPGIGNWISSPPGR